VAAAARGNVLEVFLWFFVLLAAAGIAAAALYFAGYFPLPPSAAAFFGPRAEKRLDVVEQSNVDGRRRLVLIRRDDVEHLIMTGGPVDVVIETNIDRSARAAAGGAQPSPPASVHSYGGKPLEARS
jgi:hypothetical protein